jgi:outer membrane protein assembly factor BamB
MKISLLGLLVLVGPAAADDWPAWRGPAGTGVSAEKSAPTTWATDKNVRWKAPLPRPGFGSPIVSKGRVFVTCAEEADGSRRSLYCFDRKDGKKLWAATVNCPKGMPQYFDEGEGYCATTPAADGERVVVWEGTGGLHCYDFEGTKLWSRELGEFRHKWGLGGSPILHDGKVILNAGPGKRVFMTAIDVKSGKTLWETEEFKREKSDFNDTGKGHLGSWCTPIVAKVEGKDQIICAQPSRVVGYDPADGKVLWWCEGIQHDGGAHDLAYSSPVVAGDVLMYVGGFIGPGLAVRLGGKGDVTQTHRLWRQAKRPQSIGSGVFVEPHVIMPFEGAIQCIDPRTGKQIWQDRGAGGGYWGSIVSAGGRCYLTNKKGTTVVFKSDPQKFELLATNALGEESNSTPAISEGQIFIRTFKHLYCIGE